MSHVQFVILLICVVIFGGAMGAFFGTVEYRVRNHKKLITSGCFCTSCGHILTLPEQIPVLGWLMLRGRCRYCGERIPIRYPLIEGTFTLYYTAVFLLLRDHPAAIPLSWYIFTACILAARSCGNVRPMLRGMALFALYHLIVGLLVVAVLSAPH